MAVISEEGWARKCEECKRLKRENRSLREKAHQLTFAADNLWADNAELVDRVWDLEERVVTQAMATEMLLEIISDLERIVTALTSGEEAA